MTFIPISVDKKCKMCGGELAFRKGYYPTRCALKIKNTIYEVLNKPIWISEYKYRYENRIDKKCYFRSKMKIFTPRYVDTSYVNIWVYQCIKCLQVTSNIPLRNKTIFRKRTL
jgi:hypothetical protein